MNELEEIGAVLEQARQAAIKYYKRTGKPLGITGEYGEYIAAERLGLNLAKARTAGYDATDKNGRQIQIKARKVSRGRSHGGQRLGSIRLDHEWDAVFLVVMDELFQIEGIYEAERPAIVAALEAPGSRARNERGQLSLSKFKSIRRQIWPTAL